MAPRTCQYQYKLFLKECGVHYRNFHILRHTYATRCVERGIDVKSVSEMHERTVRRKAAKEVTEAAEQEETC